METLPNVIINIILEYQGYHTWRNGKYIPRLNIKDTKMIDDRLYLYVITTSIYSNKLHWFMDKFIFDDPTVKKIKFQSQETIHYIYGHNEKQHLSRKI